MREKRKKTTKIRVHAHSVDCEITRSAQHCRQNVRRPVCRAKWFALWSLDGATCRCEAVNVEERFDCRKIIHGASHLRLRSHVQLVSTDVLVLLSKKKRKIHKLLLMTCTRGPLARHLKYRMRGLGFGLDLLS